MLSLGIGGGIGNAASGWMYDLGISLQQPMLPWVVCTVIGVVSSIGLWWTISAGGERTRRLRQAEMQVP
jgi:hypothetical protein